MIKRREIKVPEKHLMWFFALNTNLKLRFRFYDSMLNQRAQLYNADKEQIFRVWWQEAALSKTKVSQGYYFCRFGKVKG